MRGRDPCQLPLHCSRPRRRGRGRLKLMPAEPRGEWAAGLPRVGPRAPLQPSCYRPMSARPVRRRERESRRQPSRTSAHQAALIATGKEVAGGTSTAPRTQTSAPKTRYAQRGLEGRESRPPPLSPAVSVLALQDAHYPLSAAHRGGPLPAGPPGAWV